MLWQMLLPIFSKVADVVATYVIHNKSCVRPSGRCCCYCGRWYSHLINEVLWLMLLPSVADGIATVIHATYMADVIAMVAQME